MKNIFALPLALIVLTGFFSCKKTHVVEIAPTTKSTSDTSVVLIGNQELVGNWALVSDSVSTSTKDTLYQGKPSDYYIFTKYGNMYVNSGFNELIDTATYSISTDNKVIWEYSYVSQFGSGGKTTGANGGNYAITALSEHSLVLSQSATYPSVGPRTEVIKLKK